MNEYTNQSVRETVEQKAKAPKAETKELTPLKREELQAIEGGACALLRVPPYWRCW